jgi:hypothetical protein
MSHPEHLTLLSSVQFRLEPVLICDRFSMVIGRLLPLLPHCRTRLPHISREVFSSCGARPVLQ